MINNKDAVDTKNDKNEIEQNQEADADYYALKKWELGFLRRECVNLGLEVFYNKYMARVQRSYLSIFVVLQTFISIAHVVVIVTGEQHPTAAIHPDLICYTFGSLIVWVSLFAAFKERLIKAHPWVPYVTSCAAIFTLIVADIMIPLYHAAVTFMNPPLRPSYANHIIFAIYIFLPLSENYHVIILGAATTVCYLIIMALISYRLESDMIIKVTTELIYFLCLNLFGLYFRLINEIAIRRTFLDRRELVEGNLLLKFARNQEKELLLSILPEHTAELMEKDIRVMIEKMRNGHHNNINPQNFFRTGTQWRSINKLYVQKHTNVTILYADVVNYTYITTQLPVKSLVDVLHELFVKFDEAAKEFNVLRIKFLGDCYYCVSGVPIKNKYHAKSCVDLGLRMIKDIRDVRMSRDLNIDMRIGIHSGSIISGVIGACKWQYDIWSKDVIIANKLESTGEAGKVHVTMQTLELLDGEYIYEDGTEKAKVDPVLMKHNIQTFLIVPQFSDDSNYYGLSESATSSRLSVGVKRKTIQIKKERSQVTRNFMQNSMEQFREIMKQTNVEMAKELDGMPIGKFQFNKIFSTRRDTLQQQTSSTPYYSNGSTNNENINDSRLDNLSTFFMCFENKRWEWLFMKEPDLMLKYSVLMSFIVFVCIFLIQVLDKASGFYFWMVMVASGIILFCFIPITWFRKIMKGDVKPCAGNQGTQIAVEDLFYNVPMRKQALKAPNEEFQKISDVVSKYAVHNPQTGFMLKKFGENATIRTQAKSTVENNISLIYGSSIGKSLLKITIDDEILQLQVDGFVTNVNFSLKKGMFLLFINHRAVESTNIRKAIDQIYSLYLPKGMAPFVYLSIELNPNNVDVNVHPTKHEVHFLHEEEIIDKIKEAVERSLLGGNASRTFYTQALLPGAPEPAETSKLNDSASDKPKLDYKFVRTSHSDQKLDKFFGLNVSRNASMNENTNGEQGGSFILPKQDRSIRETKLTSVLSLRKAVEEACDRSLRTILSELTFVGVIDRNWVLIQYDTKMFLVTTRSLFEELCYQMLLFNFENFESILFTRPLPVLELAMLALEDAESGWTEEDGSKNELAERILEILVNKAPLMKEYFNLCISADGMLESIPIVVQEYIPSMAYLPMFILRLATEVEWDDEKECFDTFCREVARFYAKIALTKGDDEYKWELEHAIYPAIKQYLLPPKTFAKNGSVLKVANLPDLYRVFERC